MQSLADVLEFLFRQPSTFTGNSDPTANPPILNRLENEPLSGGLLAPLDGSALPQQNFGDQQPVLGPGYVPFTNLGTSAFQSPGWDVPNGPSGGILGGLPFATGRASDDSQPKGILHTYDNPEQRQVGRPQAFDLQTPGVSLPFAPPLGSNSLTVPDSLIAAPRVPPAALSNRPLTGQAFSPSQKLTDGEYPQVGDVDPSGSPLVTSLITPQWLKPRNAVDARPEFPNGETYRKSNISALIHHPDRVGPGATLNDNWVPPSASPGGERDWSAYLQPAQVIDPSAVTGDPRIDRTTEILLDTLVEAVKEMGVDPSAPMRSVLFGTLAHSHFARKVKALDLPGIGEDGIEQNWHKGDLWDYGISGAKRTDIYLKDPLGNPIAIYDLKTGNARLTPARIRELREAVGGKNIPVIELRWRDVMALQR
jgi:hypothetical protein